MLISPEVTEGKENVASFEFIPWVLGQCANMKEVRALLAKINITGTPFAENMPAGFPRTGSLRTLMRLSQWNP